jgi:hypothetical protein
VRGGGQAYSAWVLAILLAKDPLINIMGKVVCATSPFFYSKGYIGTQDTPKDTKAPLVRFKELASNALVQLGSWLLAKVLHEMTVNDHF